MGTRTHAEIATSAASQIATVATWATGIVETIATSVTAPTPARLVRSRGAAATAVDRPTDRAAAGDPLIGLAAVEGHPTGPAAVEGLPTGQALVGETVGRAILPHRHLVAMESLLHRNDKKHLCDKKSCTKVR